MGCVIIDEEAKKEVMEVMSIFVEVSEENTPTLDIYIIDNKQKVTAQITLEDSLEIHNKVMKFYSHEEQVIGTKTYQASLLNSRYKEVFAHNVYYPLDNNNKPIYYNEVQLIPVIKGETIDEKIIDLGKYVDGFFKSPLYKQSNVTPKGIIFSDSLNINVQYTNAGVLTFSQRVKESKENVTELEKIDVVNRFIKDSEAIPESLKVGLYLKSIEEKDHKTIYKYGYRFEGFEVCLTDAIKTELGIEEFLELEVKSGEIAGGRWIMLELQETTGDTSYSYMLTREGYVVINQVQENWPLVNSKTQLLETMECAYIIESTNKIKFDWTVKCDDKWYYP